MDDVKVFLAHAIQLEREAARRYEELTAAMATAGNREVAQFFRQMAEFSRLHLKDAMKRGGFQDIPNLAPSQWQWPDGTSPEAAAWEGIDNLIDVDAALALALDGEERGHAFYAAIAETTQDAEVRHMAKEFAAEEAEHVAELRKWISRHAA